SQPAETRVTDEPSKNLYATATPLPPTAALVTSSTPLETNSASSPADPLEHKLFVLTSEDLAAHLNVNVGQIHLVSIESLNWPDTSLGCPQPNIFYAQVLTPGYRITLQVGTKQYEYHSDTEGLFLLCDPMSPPDLQRTPGWRLPPSN
ncbi:hypothetical protein ACFLZW_06610, partial [Chloroflexota bacterium]